MSHFFHKNLTNGDKQIIDAMKKRADDSRMTKNSSNSFPLLKNKVSTEIEGENDTVNDEKVSTNSIGKIFASDNLISSTADLARLSTSFHAKPRLEN